MGADFICSVLEFPKISNPEKSWAVVAPDWNKAKEHINSLSEKDLAIIINAASCLDLSTDDSDYETDSNDYDPDTWSFIDAVSDQIGFVRNQKHSLHEIFIRAIDECESLWNGNSHGTSIVLRNSVVLIAGGDLWGDPPQGVEELNLFAASGAANAAGFMDCPGIDLEAIKQKKD